MKRRFPNPRQKLDVYLDPPALWEERPVKEHLQLIDSWRRKREPEFVGRFVNRLTYIAVLVKGYTRG